MFRTFAKVSMAVMCVAPGMLAGAAMAVEAVEGNGAVVASHVDAAPAQAHNVPDIGCIGFHGTGSGYALNGQCLGKSTFRSPSSPGTATFQ
jgi:hypothetical protein